MDLVAIAIFLIGLYAVIAAILYIKKPWGDRITFYGPIIAVKSYHVRFFDWFTRYRTFLRIYGTFGVAMVVIISVVISVLLIFSVRYTLLIRPEPTGIYEPQNILLLPGINEFVPSTFAVWFAFFITIAIHELGHGILCRVEGIRVKSVGVLFAVVPIGFFVEPDEEDLERCPTFPKTRMFGAGIMNNIVIGIICFVALVSIAGMITPPTEPVIHGIYKGYPAYEAGLPPNSIILMVNGDPVTNTEEISSLLSRSRPGDVVRLTVSHEGEILTYTITLAPWPENLTPPRDSGFMGVYYYPSQEVTRQLTESLRSPLGLLYLLTVPFDMSPSGQYLRMLAFDTVDMTYYDVPFPQFWSMIHLLFWAGWINLNVGIFNAIPMVPLDGGYIMKEGVGAFLRRKGLQKYAENIVVAVTWVMLFLMISLIALPYLFHL